MWLFGSLWFSIRLGWEGGGCVCQVCRVCPGLAFVGMVLSP
jgi:hypothetical protein